MPIQSLAVFCGSKNGKNPLFSEQASQLGKLLAENNVRLIYGGANVGIMANIADAVMANGGKVTGIIPKLLLDWEHQHKKITELIVAIKHGLKLSDLAGAIHAYPTYSTAIQQMAAAATVDSMLTGTSGIVIRGLFKYLR